MVNLPAGFDVALLVSDFYSTASTFAPIIFLVAGAFLVVKILKRS